MARTIDRWWASSAKAADFARTRGPSGRGNAMKTIGWFVMLSVALADPLSSGPRAAAAQATVVPSDPGPRFRPDGHQAEAYGMNEGYPSCKGLAFIREERCRVGAFSHFDTLFPARTIAGSKEPSRLRRAPG